MAASTLRQIKNPLEFNERAIAAQSLDLRKDTRTIKASDRYLEDVGERPRQGVVVEFPHEIKVEGRERPD